MATKKTQEQVQADKSLVDALKEVVMAVKPPTKKNIFDRKNGSPWAPPDGVPKLKLKRKMYQHGILIDDAFLTNEEIALANQIRPGSYCDGHVRVIRRRDKGIDIDWPVRNSQQRLKLVNQFGLRNFSEVLQRCITEAAKPKRSEFDLDQE
jgi:hypothetical protein